MIILHERFEVDGIAYETPWSSRVPGVEAIRDFIEVFDDHPCATCNLGRDEGYAHRHEHLCFMCQSNELIIIDWEG